MMEEDDANNKQKDSDVIDWDPVHWRCTTSSSCKRSCFIFFITFQFIVILILGFTLKSFQDYHNLESTANLHEEQMSTKSRSWMLLPDRMKRLNENPVYAKFNITRQRHIPRVNLLIIVSSAPKRSDRRLAIRDTWWNQTESFEKIKVKAVFLTDEQNNLTKTGRSVLAEQQKYRDIVFQRMKGGVEFGRRFLHHMIWAMQNYDFDYFLRMDDDYFFCMKRFLHELPMPMRKMYHWGFVHCVENIVRPEESIILLSRDLIEIFLSQDPREIKGHPWADQMIATWVQELKLKGIYNHETRLHHHPPLTQLKNITGLFKNVCRKYIGVHGSYAEQMRLLWSLRKGREYVGVGLDEYTVKCNKQQIFRWTTFIDKWRYAPKRLIKNPIWDTFKQDRDLHEYIGRQGGQG